MFRNLDGPWPSNVSAWTARLGTLRRARPAGLGAAQAVHQHRVRRRLDDAVELAAVRRDEADAIDQHVVDLPASVLAQHPVLEAGLAHARVDGAAPRNDARADDGEVTVDLLRRIRDLLAGVRFD